MSQALTALFHLLDQWRLQRLGRSKPLPKIKAGRGSAAIDHAARQAVRRMDC